MPLRGVVAGRGLGLGRGGLGRRAAVGRVIQGADVRCGLDDGWIAFYSSKDCFEAHCLNPNHGRCVMTRGAGALGQSSTYTGPPVGGRPLGFLLVWLANSHQATRDEHWSVEAMSTCLEERSVHRVLLADSAEGRELLAKERLWDPERELEEPLTLAGYLPRF
jgi:hypothetical protein